jgi:hypothetical protein
VSDSATAHTPSPSPVPLEASVGRNGRQSRVHLVVGGALLVIALVWSGISYSPVQTPAEATDLARAIAPTPGLVRVLQPFVEVSKLVAAAAIGMLVTAVHRRYRRERSNSASIDQAQILLCVSGSMMMIIIADSLARAFGIAGAASIVRFRTPIDDPKDITILFLLMGLGMATGLGAFALAGLGAAFLCLFLVVLGRPGAGRPRTMIVDLSAAGPEFPVAHVQNVFARHGVAVEPREFSQGDQAVGRYRATLDATVSVEALSAALVGTGASGITSVVWAPPRNKKKSK